MPPQSLLFTGDPPADELLATDPLALLIGMLLDQQFPMERAFHSPYDLKQRLGGRLDAEEIASMDAEALAAVFRGPPALHRYPGSMAGRTQELCRVLVERYGGDASRVWAEAGTGRELFTSVRSLPGFGEQKAQIFTAILAKRMGVAPPGWEEMAGPYAQVGHFSVADVDGPKALAAVREHKKAVKAAAKAAK
ncbi:MAG TPA: HhH-GPD-type base excision DNA repair protein [Acidimicrobiales bacterium]|nr:HhH-GPD-type base excision DNA repair protein [Acidimicrobiales bacterium]